MQELIDSENENREIHKDTIAKFHDIELKNIEFRKEKMIVDEQRHIREMEDRKEERKSRAEDRQLMIMMMEKQSEMMQLLVKKFDDSKDK
jgi:hypothetical protein